MNSNIILYTSNSGNVSIQVQYEDGTFWLSQKRMAELLGVKKMYTINYHLKEIFKSGELQEDSVIRKIRITADDGKNGNVLKILRGNGSNLTFLLYICYIKV